MRKVKAILMLAVLAAVTATGAFAQKGNDNRPPKDNTKVVEKPKDKPPSNSNNQSNTNRRGKP
jgi:hypothetical protein